MKGIDMGRKYEFKAKAGPAPGQYEPNYSPTKSKLTGGVIHKKTSTYQKQMEVGPDPG